MSSDIATSRFRLQSTTSHYNFSWQLVVFKTQNPYAHLTMEAEISV